MPTSLFIEPTYPEFLGNELFRRDSPLNRDDSLRPYILMKERLEATGIKVNTADFFLRGEHLSDRNVFVSLGGTEYWRRLKDRGDISLEAFFLFEPPIANPSMYRRLKEYGPHFRHVFSFSTGLGIERYMPPGLRLEQLYCPQPYDDVINPLWNRADRKFLTAIVSNKRPLAPGPELYSERIRAIRFFARNGEIDLYGPYWDKPIPTHPFHFQWYFDLSFRRARKGIAESKYRTLAGYTFSICFENMSLKGYITEKIFDCFYTGTIPIYLGAPDTRDHIPKEAFIDCSTFRSYEDLRDYLLSRTPAEKSHYRMAARDFLGSQRFRPFSSRSFLDSILKISEEHSAPGEAR